MYRHRSIGSTSLKFVAFIALLDGGTTRSQEPDLPPLPASPSPGLTDEDERSTLSPKRSSTTPRTPSAAATPNRVVAPRTTASSALIAKPSVHSAYRRPEKPSTPRPQSKLGVQARLPGALGIVAEGPVAGTGSQPSHLNMVNTVDSGTAFALTGVLPASSAATAGSAPNVPTNSDSDVARTYYQGGFFQNQPTPGLTPDTIPSEGQPGSLYSDTTFVARLFDAYFPSEAELAREKAVADAGTSAPARRATLPPAFTSNSPPFPFSEYIGPNIGVNDTSVYPLMNALYDGPNGDWWKKSRFKIYGWLDPSYNASTSRNSNVPLSYSVVPNQLELSQAIVILERTIDTVQQDDFQFGFKFTNLYGIDYRYTTGKGYFSDQLLKHNHLYGWDPLQMYIDLYFPHIAQGMVIRAGRYISPVDIEAQLSPENYLYTHSLMYTYDPYTFTGVQFITALDDQWSLTVGAHAGNDMAPWTTSSQANGELLLKWVSKDGKDSLYGGLDSIGHGYYQHQHDDLQVLAGTWTHKFNEKFHTLTEGYFIWERNALLGGSVTDGTPQPYFEGTGAGAKLPGLSYSFGVVNYTAYKLTDKSYVVLRSDVLNDPSGFRTGYAGSYFEHTLGYIVHPTNWLTVRPEVRFDYTNGVKAYDNGTRREQFTFSCDFILKF